MHPGSEYPPLVAINTRTDTTSRLQVFDLHQTDVAAAEKPDSHKRDKMRRLHHDGAQRPRARWVRMNRAPPRSATTMQSLARL